MEEGGAKSQEINARKKEVEREIKDRQERSDREVELIEDAYDTFRKFKPKELVESEQLWREIYFRYADYFEGGMGAEAVKALLDTSRPRRRDGHPRGEPRCRLGAEASAGHPADEGGQAVLGGRRTGPRT